MFSFAGIRNVDHRIPHLTHYELNVAGRSDFARHRRDHLPSVEQNLEMYRVAQAFLEANGYRQATPVRLGADRRWARRDPGLRTVRPGALRPRTGRPDHWLRRVGVGLRGRVQVRRAPRLARMDFHELPARR